MIAATRRVVLLVAGFAAIGLSSVADAKLATSGSDGKATFLAVGPAGMKIEGSTSEVKVAEDGDNVSITVPLGNLSTGIDLRDKHMKEKYLEVPTYPDAVLTIAKASLKLPAAGAEETGDGQGTLKLHGQSKPVSVHYTVKADGGELKVNGSTKVNMKEFGIEVPSYLGVTVKPDVDVKVRFSAKDG